MRRRTLLSSVGGGTDPSQASPLEVAFYNGSRIVIREESEWKDGETPIGIVVVPGYHNRYGDGTCGIMSLVGMDYNHPETGMIVSSSGETDYINMYWGYYKDNVRNSIFSSNMPNRQYSYYIPYQKSDDSTATTTASSSYVQWPYGGTSTSPTSAKSETSDVVVPSMSATNGHAFGDFNGIKNTAACYVATKSGSQWTASTVPNTTGATNTPAAACAGRFKTVGTKSFYDVYSGITSGDVNYGTSGDTYGYKGMWYLPSVGELCYLPSKMFEINKTILALNSKYGKVGVRLQARGFFSAQYHSSSEYDYGSVYYMSANGYMCYTVMYTSSFFVRAFMRL